MISLLRVDEKLLHSAIIFSWVENLGIQSILIADDGIANDKFMCMSFGLGKPSHVELSILDLTESFSFLKQHLHDSLRLMVIVGNLCSAKSILERYNEIQTINVGYLHEFGAGEEINPCVHLTEDEIQICKMLKKKGIQINFQAKYSDEKHFFGDKL